MRSAAPLALFALLSATPRPTRADPPAPPAAAALEREALDLLQRERPAEALVAAERAAEARGTPTELARRLHLLGRVLLALGRYDRAAATLERAVSLAGQGAPPGDLDADPVHALAEALAGLGRYTEAMRWFERAIELRERQRGPADPAMAASVRGLAAAWLALGRRDRALPLFELALRITEGAHSPAHPEVAAGLDPLAATFYDAGDVPRALALWSRALRIRELALGQAHAASARSACNVVAAMLAAGREADAAPLAERATRALEAALGADHPDVASASMLLAEASRALGRQERVVPLLTRALQIREAALGPEHPAVAEALQALAGALWRQGQPTRALQLLERAMAIVAREVQGVSAERRAADLARFVEARRSLQYELITLAVEQRGDARARALGWSAALAFKGRDAAAAALALAAARGASGGGASALRAWSDAVQRRATLLAMTGRAAPTPERRQALARAEAEVESAENDLARQSAALQAERRLREVSTLTRDVAARLATDAALIELVAYRPFRVRAVRAADRWGPLRYAAFVLHPDGANAVVDLGDAAPIDDRAAALLRAAAHPGASGGADAVEAAGDALGTRLFNPVRAALRPTTRRLVLAPDASLHVAPLHLMRDGWRYLLDRFVVSFVTTGRDLLREDHPAPQGPVLVGVTRYAAAAWNRGGFRAQTLLLRPLLPSLRVLEGDEATERALRGVTSPLLLHFAGHGLFRAGRRADDDFDEALRGRLLMADARPDLSTPPEGDDGQVTAAEIATMDLRGTRLVVLSACNTAQSGAVAGSGPAGLRRAFLTAGAAALVTSLWEVDDELSVTFIDALYRALLQGRTAADAVARAAQVVRRRDPHPFAWAPFIFVGRDTSLDLAPPGGG